MLVRSAFRDINCNKTLHKTSAPYIKSFSKTHKKTTKNYFFGYKRIALFGNYNYKIVYSYEKYDKGFGFE